MNDASGSQKGILDALDGMKDAELQEVAKRAQAIIAARDQERRREALREIQRLAKEHGIGIELKDAPGKRGRPAKPKSESAE